MAVFTQVNQAELSTWLQTNYAITLGGEPQPITEGIENTNYRITDASGTTYIFTIVEVWDLAITQYCVGLASHLTAAGAPVPQTLRSQEGELCPDFAGKPAVVTEFITGAPHLQPDLNSCAQMGTAIAVLHTAAHGYAGTLPNQRGADWRTATAAKLHPTLAPEERELLAAGLAAQHQVLKVDLPQAACHCDLFRNNVLWNETSIAGIIDFFFAGHDLLSFDLAVAGVDWCMDDEGLFDGERLAAIVSAYAQQRPLATAERNLLPQIFAVAALRFWLSRLLDLAEPRTASTLVAHNPDSFRRRLVTILDSSAEFAQL